MAEQTFSPSRLECARQMRGKTRWDIAHNFGIQVPKVGRWERGESTPTPQQVHELAFLLNFPLGWFYAPELEPLDWRDTSLRFHCR